MSISTKTGDSGETSLRNERVKKHHPRIESFGTLDELNAIIGIASCHATKDTIRDLLEHIQQDLFIIQADIAQYNMQTTADMITFLDKIIEQTEQALPKQTQFLLPRGTLATTHLHHARCVCRRAERIISKLADYDEVRFEVKQYLNRLSDALHLFARAESDKEYPVTYQRS